MLKQQEPRQTRLPTRADVVEFATGVALAAGGTVALALMRLEAEVDWDVFVTGTGLAVLRAIGTYAAAAWGAQRVSG